MMLSRRAVQVTPSTVNTALSDHHERFTTSATDLAPSMTENVQEKAFGIILNMSAPPLTGVGPGCTPME